MMMPVTKTDEKDAYMIAMYGEKMNPPIYKMPSQATIRILTTEGFTYFDNAKQLSRFIGICPTYQQSRTSVNIREHINRNDDERLRSLLYIAFWTALRYNSRECYIRLKANEKPFKVALIAVTNKLVRPVLTITTINSIYRWICPGKKIIFGSFFIFLLNYLLFNTFPHKYSLALPASTWKIRILKN